MIEKLMIERQKHHDQISKIELQIETAISQKQPVNELYGRINFLSLRITEIDAQLSTLSPGDENRNEAQAQIAHTIAAFGGTFIRPGQNLISPQQADPGKQTPGQSTITPEGKVSQLTTTLG